MTENGGFIWQPHSLIRLLQVARVDLSDEKRTQSDLENIFVNFCVPYKREFRLSKTEIPDFMVSGSAIEVKLRGARKKDIFRQLERYASHDLVKSIILVTNVTMGLPETICEKPVYIVALGKAWI